MVVGIAYIWCNEWQEIETLETGNKQINNFRKEINEIQIHRKHTIFRLDAHYSQPYLCAVTFNNNDYGKRKSKLSGGI